MTKKNRHLTVEQVVTLREWLSRNRAALSSPGVQLAEMHRAFNRQSSFTISYATFYNHFRFVLGKPKGELRPEPTAARIVSHKPLRLSERLDALEEAVDTLEQQLSALSDKLGDVVADLYGDQ